MKFKKKAVLTRLEDQGSGVGRMAGKYWLGVFTLFLCFVASFLFLYFFVFIWEGEVFGKLHSLLPLIMYVLALIC